MRITVQLLICIICFNALHAQKNNSIKEQSSSVNYETIYSPSDYLTPSKSSLNSRLYEHRYDLIIRQILFDQLPKYFDIQYYSAPSFDSERVLVIRNGMVYYHITNKNIWSTYYDEIFSDSNLKDINKSALLVKRYQLKISEQDSKLIERLYRAALSKAHYRIYEPEEINRVSRGSDGTTHTFSIHNLGIKEGETWSPAKGSRMFKLVNIHDRLINLITKDESAKRLLLHQNLSNDIKRLIDEFNTVELTFQKNTINSIKDTIVRYLNHNLKLKELSEQGYYVAKDLIYTIKDGQVKKVKPQENYYGFGISKFAGWFNNIFDKKVGKVYKKTLKNLDLSYLNLELNLEVYIDLKLNKENYKLDLRN